MTSEVCTWTQLSLFEGCEEQVKVLVPSKPKVWVNHLEVFKIYRKIRKKTPSSKRSVGGR